MKLELYLQEIKKIQEDFLKDRPEYIKFNPPIEPGKYKCIRYMWGMPSEETLYCDGDNFIFYFDNGSWCTEKVSHYIPT